MSLLDQFNLDNQLSCLTGNLELEFVKGNKSEKVWNELIDRYHYLGYRPVVGRCIKYLIKCNGSLLGAISFGSPAWRLSARDKVLQTLGITNPLDQVINNTRFLILPSVHVKNLASRALSLASKKVVQDWRWYYSITPIVAETFILPSTYNGACYKAANWLDFGITKGYSKKGSSYQIAKESKKLFLYGLDKITRKQLRTIWNLNASVPSSHNKWMK